MKRIFIIFSCVSLLAAAQARDLDAELDNEAQTQTGTAITIIFDNSGSMKSKGKIDQAKRAFAWWLESLPEEHRLGLIHFYRSRGKLGEAIAPGNRDQVRDTVNQLEPSGKTPLVHCLQLAAEEVKRRRMEIGPYERHVVVLFTDGYETVHSGKNDAVVKSVAKLREEGIEVVGIGFHGQGDYLQDVSTSYYHASSEDELRDGLAQVDAEIDSNTEIELTADDLEFLRTTKIPLPPAPSEFTAKAR
ncbi:MAG: vWA domain-containing protein [Verrucomicrobiota bacterium]